VLDNLIGHHVELEIERHAMEEKYVKRKNAEIKLTFNPQARIIPTEIHT
jgi:hypothetical protein